MDCPVLKYDHKDFEVIIQTDEIQSAWERFQGRINYRNGWTDETSEASKYCAYDVSLGCKIQLYDYAYQYIFRYTGYICSNACSGNTYCTQP